MSTQSISFNNCLVPWCLGVLILLVILGNGGAKSRNKFNYCQADLCSAGTRHVACNRYKFGANCSRPILINMSPKYINLILNYHNTKRNQLACGSMGSYSSASSMQKLHWNDELAKLAEYNAKSCHFAHDECHNTVQFRKTGQSIGMKWFHGSNYTASYVIRDLLRKWFIEHKLTKQQDLDRYVFSPHGFEIGHFTQMVHADTTEIGCAFVRFQKLHNNLHFIYYYLVCNYSEGNIAERPVYPKGKRCSKCSRGCTKGKFRCLCRR
ncbi:antigen 5 like allergen Cul n 1-like [Wyeomyia smithii]|uniref:antigen 5 like allergen Cul n 1-like n=1 Tax=Wyeomyia smithii TaxID=174621 RepID=UPI002467BF73|nr:antigen 5 like allergen Cul n 1-like [Wyeomyia smithii]